MTYPNGYTYRRLITIDNTKVSGSSDHSNTTIPFAGTYSYLADTSNGGLVTSSAGNDIRFELADGTKLNHDLAYYSNTTGVIEAWIKIPTIYYSVDTEIYVYYGKSGASAEEDKTNAWDSDFDSVYHLNENMDGTTDEVKDSKGSNDGTGGNGVANECPTQTTGVTGVANQGQSFNPATYQQHINFGDVHDVGTGDKTAIAFVKTGATTTAMSIIAKSLYGGTNNRYYPLGFAGTGDLQSMCMFGATNVQSLWTDSPAHNDDTWRMYTSRVDRDGNNDLLVDGVVKATNSISAYSATDVNNAYDFLIGCYNDPDGVGRHDTYGGWDGEIDEVWMITGVRTDDWLATVSNAALDPSTFYSVAAEETADWYDSAWKYRTKIEIDNTKVDADLTDYPIYIDLSDLNAGFHTNVNQTDGRDIRVTTSDGVTEVPREVVFYDSTTDTGELHFKGNILSTVNTSFYIYYGNSTATEPAASATYGSQNVWNSNYKAVYHMHETSGAIQDSTVNANHSVATSGTPDYSQTGKLGDGIQFIDTSDENFSLGNGSDFDFGTGAFTIQNWIKTTQNATYKGILGKYNGSSTGIAIENHSGKYRAWVNGTTFDSTTSINTDAWVSLYTTRASSGGAIKGYVNGAQDGSSTNANTVNCTNNMYIGMFGSTANDLNGSLDETRFLNTELTSTWISTEYNNQNSPSTFYSVSAQEGYWYNTNWSYRVKITVDYTNVAEDLTNYPMYVDLSDLPTDFHTNVNQTDARDIRVTNYDGQTELAREVVAYDSTGDTGELHFLADSVSSTTNTDFYIYYGNAAASDYATTDTYGSEAVWTNYAYVSHDGGLVDSSGNLSPSNVGSTTTTGKMGDGRAFNGSTQYVNLNTTSLLDGATAASIQAWVYLTGTLTRDYPILAKWDGTGWLMWVDDSTSTASPISATDTVAWSVNTTGAGGRVNGSSGLVSQNTWAQFTSTFEASTALRMYKNGTQSQVMTTGVVSSVITDDAAAYVGNSSHASSIKWFQGTLDEIRLVTSTLSANWISTEYVNQSAPSTFYSLSTQESAPVATVDKTIQAKANITPAYTTVTKTVTAKARVKLSSTTKTIQAKARVTKWYNTSWQKRVKITVDNTKVDADLTSYPAYLDLSDLPTEFHTNVNQTDARDIRITTDDGETEVPREVVFYDSTTDSGEVHFKCNILNTTDVSFYVYYKNASASDYAITDTYGAENVWDSNYKVVHHLAEASGTPIDSTSNSNDATTASITSYQQLDGTGYAVDLVSTNSDSIATTYSGVTNGAGTMEIYVKPDSTAPAAFWSVDDTNVSGGTNFHSQIYTTTLYHRWGSTADDITATASTYITGGAWHYIVSGWDSTSVFAYRNATLIGTKSSPALANALTGTMTYGSWYDGARNLDGLISEFRLSNIKRSAGWITTTSNNLNSPSTFFSFGFEEAGPITATTVDKTIQAKTRIKLLATTKTIQSKTRIASTGITKTIQSLSRIDGSSSLSYDAFANSASSGYYLDSATESIAYRFIAKESLTVNQISVQFSSVTSAPTYLVGLKADSAGEPTGSYLTSGTVTPGSDGWQDVTVPDYAITQGTTYHVVISYNSGTIGASNRVSMYGFNEFDSRYPYDLTEGNFRYLFSNDSGSTWTTTNQQPRFAINKSFGNPIDGFVQGRVYGDRYRGQRISFAEDTPISALGFWITKAGSPSGDLVCEIQTDGGTTLATGTLGTPSDIEATYFNFYHVVFSQITLSANTYYRVFIKTTGGDASNYYDSLGYTTGEASLQHLSYGGLFSQATISNDAGTAWTEYPQYDFLFEVSNAKDIQAKARIFFYGLWSDTRSYTVTSPITTQTKTVTAKARVKYADQTKTITAKARVKQLATTKSVTAKARIQTSGITKTITAKARIKYTSVTKTITAKSRIKYSSVTKSITTKARVLLSGVTKTITSKARILLNQAKTVQAKTRVKYSSVTKTITAKARVKLLTAKSIQSLARIKNYSTKTVQAKARIVSTGITKSVTAKARVKLIDQAKTIQSLTRVKYTNVTKSITSKARVLLNKTKTITSKARIKLLTEKTISALADIRKLDVTKTIQSRARIKYTAVTKSIQSKARVKFVNVTKTVQSKARILLVKTKTIQSKARIKLPTIKTIEAKARITSSGVTKSIQSLARIKVLDNTKSIQALARVKYTDVTKTIQSKARVLFNKIKSITSKARILLNQTKSITAKARVLLTSTKTIQSKSRVKLLVEKTISAKARVIGGGVLKDIQAKARIKLLGQTQSITTKSRIKLLKEKSIQSRARIKLESITKTISALARLKVLSEQTVQAKARIKSTGTAKTITARARIKYVDQTKIVQSKAKILLVQEKSIQAKARVKLIVSKTIDAKARILSIVDKTIESLARVKNTSVQSIQAKARILATGISKSVSAKARIKLIQSKTISTKARIKELNSKTISARACIKYTEIKTIQAKAAIDKNITKTISAKATIRVENVTKTISAKTRIKSSGTAKSIQAKAFIAILAPESISVTHGTGIEDVVDNVVVDGQSKPTFIFVEGISKPTIESLYGSNILSGKIIINQVSGLTAPSIFKVV